jgi:RiboL-PSP-HEPN
MPSPEEVFTELEADRASREAELRLIERMIATAESEDDKAMLRRSIILLAYAHLEGCCKFALSAYAAAVNAEELRCADASPAIAAASLTRVFRALRDQNKKHDAFRRTLPDDSVLHLCAREQEFVEDYERFIALKVRIPDSLIDTKSNVDAEVLKKLLYQLGLEVAAVDLHRSNINRLLGIRNHIAHGDRFKVPSDAEVAECVGASVAIMSFLQTQVFEALSGGVYRRFISSEGNMEAAT